jgi:purine-binding chemotaxis protein CheW
MMGYLLIRVSGDRYGLPIEEVVEVVDNAKAETVLGAQHAVRGIARIRGRMVPVVHLGALLTGCSPPSECTHTVVVARCGDRRVAFEVDDADAVVREAPVSVPPEVRLPWISGVARHNEELIPILDMDVLSERLTARYSEAIP